MNIVMLLIAVLAGMLGSLLTAALVIWSVNRGIARGRKLTHALAVPDEQGGQS